MRVLLSPPDVRGDEVQAVTDAIASGWLAPAGPALANFEQELAAASGRQHAVGLASGTAGLQLSLVALGVTDGDLVACSTLTFVATANAIRHAGAVPVFIDSELDSWNIDPDILEAEMSTRAGTPEQFAAVIAVDLYGQCADYTRIAAACTTYEVALIEDAAEALGSTCDGKPAGSYGEAAIFSFNGNKIITSSGGGMFVTDDKALADRIRYLSTQAREAAIHYEHTEIGWNFRLSNVLAALGSAQLATLPERVARRREINTTYRDRLAGAPGVTFMPEAPWGTCTFWLTCLTIDPSASPTSGPELVSKLQAEGIECRPVWKPMHMQPVYADATYVGGTVAESLFETGICLPSGSGMTAEQLDLVCDVLAPLVHP